MFTISSHGWFMALLYPHYSHIPHTPCFHIFSWSNVISHHFSILFPGKITCASRFRGQTCQGLVYHGRSLDFEPRDPIAETTVVVRHKWRGEVDLGIEEVSKVMAGWWFRTFFVFPYIGNHHPNWLIFFRGVQTTNQMGFFIDFQSGMEIFKRICHNHRL